VRDEATIEAICDFLEVAKQDWVITHKINTAVDMTTLDINDIL
jgi:hypothetical protein